MKDLVRQGNFVRSIAKREFILTHFQIFKCFVGVFCFGLGVPRCTQAFGIFLIFPCRNEIHSYSRMQGNEEMKFGTISFSKSTVFEICPQEICRYVNGKPIRLIFHRCQSVPASFERSLIFYFRNAL